MKKLFFLIIIITLYIACSEKEPPKQEKPVIQQKHVMVEDAIKLSMPIDSAFGDLDKDGIEEKILVFNTNKDSYRGKARKMEFFKKVDNTWKLYYQTSKGYYPESKSAEPYMKNKVEIENGILQIIYFNKWKNNDGKFWHREILCKYRFQEKKFKLIGYTMQEWLPCFFKKTIDYNLSTNKVIYSDKPLCHPQLNTTRKPKSDSFYHKMDEIITLDNFNHFWGHEIISPKYGIIGAF